MAMRGSAINRVLTNKLCAAAPPTCRRFPKLKLGKIFAWLGSADAEEVGHSTLTPRPDVLSVAADNLSGPQEFLKESCFKVLFVTRYAIDSSIEVFHLLTDSEDWTKCGLKVVPIIINRPAKSSALYLTEIVEQGRRVCDRCAAVETEVKERAP